MEPGAYKAAEYDVRIGAILPYYVQFHRETIDLVRSLRPAPGRWLDTGCGTGKLVLQALAAFPGTAFVLADPSPAMLDLAAAKVAGPRVQFAQGESRDLDFAAGSFDVVTAILSHHYHDAPGREIATANCRRMLGNGGVFVTFEHIRPFSAAGTQAGLKRWKEFQLRQGRSPEQVERNLARFDREYFPLTITGHLEMLRRAGFAAVEVFWASHLQAGFWARKG